MENLMELPMTALPSLLLLNEYCLLELFEFLKLEDSINLAETCIYLSAIANHTFRKYSTMVLDNRMAEKRKECIYRFFTRFGHQVLSLIICFAWGPSDGSIVRNCKNLKRFEMHSVSGGLEDSPLLFTVDNLKELSLVRCHFKRIQSLLNVVRKVNALNICCCYEIECNALATVFRNSPDMKSFEWLNDSCIFDLNLLDTISNVERLRLDVEFKNVSELDPLLKLNRLLKLKLRCRGKNTSSFLSELAKKGIMQELELTLDEIDGNLFEILKSFDKLQLLVLHKGPYRCTELNASIIWPPKHFRLNDFEFTLDVFLSAIKQLKYLERICVNDCWIAVGERHNFNDVTNLSEQILFAIDDCDRKQRLDFVLPGTPKFETDFSKKYLLDSELLRIYNYTSSYESPLEIGINFRKD